MCPSETLSPSTDFPVAPVIRLPCSADFSSGRGGFLQLLSASLPTVLSLTPRRSLSPLQPVAMIDVAFALRMRARPPVHGFSRPSLGSFALRPGDLLAILKMALSIGFRSSLSFPPAIQATGPLTLAPVGLSPTERASVCWTRIPISCSTNHQSKCATWAPAAEGPTAATSAPAAPWWRHHRKPCRPTANGRPSHPPSGHPVSVTTRRGKVTLPETRRGCPPRRAAARIQTSDSRDDQTRTCSWIPATNRAPGGWWSSASRRAASRIWIGVNPRRASLLSAAPKIPAITWEETSHVCAISKAEWGRWQPSPKYRRITFSCRGSRTGKWRPNYAPKLKKRTALLAKLRDVFRGFVSQPVGRVIEVINPMLRKWVNYFAVGHASECFAFIKNWVEKKIRLHLMAGGEAEGFGWKR
jgi:hypothetical protein